MTDAVWYYKKGSMQLGPYSTDRMRALARQGQIGRSHQISNDGGNTWTNGAAFPEIFAAGDSPQEEDAGSRKPAGGPAPPTAAVDPSGAPSWHYCPAGQEQQGPVSESQLRELIDIGRIRRDDMVWTEALGSAWVAAGSVPRLTPFFRAPDPVIHKEGQDPAEEQRDSFRERSRPRRRAAGREDRTASKDTPAGFNAAGLSGFICSMVAIVLLALPCVIWVVVAESFFWMFNIVIPLTALAVVGLVLSVIGLGKTPRGMATTGTVLGVLALMLGVMALVGWFMLPYRLAMQRRTQIDSFATDIKLEAKTLEEELVKYRNIKKEPDDTDESVAERRAGMRRVVGMQLGKLVRAYDGHVSATAKTSEFEQAFLEIGQLRKTIEDVGQAAKTVENIQLGDLLSSANLDTQGIKVLMDTLRLFERGEITLKQAEAKMTGR